MFKESGDKMGVVNSEQFIFLNKYGNKVIDKSYVNVKLKELFKKYDIHIEGNISSHMFRKTLGNRVLRLNNYSNQSIVLLMELFSHSSPIFKSKVPVKLQEAPLTYTFLESIS